MRDWERDWELCQKATPGPWAVRDEFRVHSPNSPVVHYCAVGYKCDFRRRVGDIHYSPYGHNSVVINCQPLSWASVCQARANAQFIAEAREALPYWLQQFRKIVEVLKDAEIYIHGKGPVTIDEILEEECNTFEGEEER